MVADFFTKPLQGALFGEFRLIIMNLSDEDEVPTQTPQECVGGTDAQTALMTARRLNDSYS